jgi:hypothetical protein
LTSSENGTAGAAAGAGVDAASLLTFVVDSAALSAGVSAVAVAAAALVAPAAASMVTAPRAAATAGTSADVAAGTAAPSDIVTSSLQLAKVGRGDNVIAPSFE